MRISHPKEERIKRIPYETPKVTVMGSVKELTQHNIIGVHADATFGIVGLSGL